MVLSMYMLAMLSRMSMLSMIFKNMNQNFGSNLLIQDILLAISYGPPRNCYAPRPSDQYLVTLKIQETLFWV